MSWFQMIFAWMSTYLLSWLFQILEMNPEDEAEEDGANIDLDSQRKGKCVVLKTSTRQVNKLARTCSGAWISICYYIYSNCICMNYCRCSPAIPVVDATQTNVITRGSWSDPMTTTSRIIYGSLGVTRWLRVQCCCLYLAEQRSAIQVWKPIAM